jgi:hypothetical protein
MDCRVKPGNDNAQSGRFPDSNFKQLALASSPGLTGRSSIPETVRAHTRRHGVLDAPLEAGHDDLGTHLHPLATRRARAVQKMSPSENRGRRESRVPAAPAASCAKCRKHTSSSPQVHRDTRPSLRNGFNGFFRALPGDRAFLPPSLARIAPRNLTPASGRQDHTTSPSAISNARLASLSRPPHPVPTFVTIAIRPSDRDGTGWILVLIWGRDQRCRLRQIGTTGKMELGFQLSSSCPALCRASTS